MFFLHRCIHFFFRFSGCGCFYVRFCSFPHTYTGHNRISTKNSLRLCCVTHCLYETMTNDRKYTESRAKKKLCCWPMTVAANVKKQKENKHSRAFIINQINWNKRPTKKKLSTFHVCDAAASAKKIPRFCFSLFSWPMPNSIKHTCTHI